MDFAFITDYTQKKADGTRVNNWLHVVIGSGNANVWHYTEVMDYFDDIDYKQGKYLSAGHTQIFVNAEASEIIFMSFWTPAKDNTGEYRIGEVRKWLTERGYLPIEDVVESMKEREVANG